MDTALSDNVKRVADYLQSTVTNDIKNCGTSYDSYVSGTVKAEFQIFFTANSIVNPYVNSWNGIIYAGSNSFQSNLAILLTNNYANKSNVIVRISKFLYTYI